MKLKLLTIASLMMIANIAMAAHARFQENCTAQLKSIKSEELLIHLSNNTPASGHVVAVNDEYLNVDLGEPTDNADEQDLVLINVKDSKKIEKDASDEDQKETTFTFTRIATVQTVSRAVYNYFPGLKKNTIIHFNCNGYESIPKR